MTKASSTTKTGWWRLLLAALAAAVAVLLGAGTASATTVPNVETRVGASTVATAYPVGVHESVSAGQRWGHAPPTAETTVATGVAAKAGPGAWGSAAEAMSGRAAAYQSQITGRAAGSVYRVNGVKFDGFANGVLQEAKGPGYAKFVRNGQFQPWFSGADGLASQAQRQLSAAGGTPITWSVAEADAATAINNLFVSRGISGIDVVHVP